jgi:cell division protein FtsL
VNGVGSFLRAAFTVAVLVGALAAVTWRQSRGFETAARLDDIRRQISVAEAEQVDLERHIQVLESRTHVVPAARARLGMHTATTSELVILPGDVNP